MSEPLDLGPIRARVEAATEGPREVAPEKCGPNGQGVYHATARVPLPSGMGVKRVRLLCLDKARNGWGAAVGEREGIAARVEPRSRCL